MKKILSSVPCIIFGSVSLWAQDASTATPSSPAMPLTPATQAEPSAVEKSTNATLEKGFKVLEDMIDHMESYGDYVKTYIYAHELNLEVLKSIKDGESAQQATKWMDELKVLGNKFETKAKTIAEKIEKEVTDKTGEASDALKAEFDKVKPQMLKVRLESAKLMEYLGEKAYYGSKKLADMLAPEPAKQEVPEKSE